MDVRHYLITGEAASYLEQQLQQEVNYYDLDNLIRSKAIDPPELIGGRRMWSPENLREAAKALRIRRAKRPSLTDERSLINKKEEN